jgi:threonine dehydratase
VPTINAPTFTDVLKARLTIAPYLSRTPLVSYPQLDALLNAEVYVKREDCNPTSAFKIRGGINLMANLSPEERARGVIGSSTGNHGQSIAYAARLFGVRCTIGLPENANPVKVAAMRSLGATLEFHGNVFDEARVYVEQIAATRGFRYIHSANEPLLIAGVATSSLEVLEEVPDLDYIFVPLGGGSGAAGACIVCKTVRPETRVVAVQSAQARAGYDSWEAGELVERPMQSIAEGLATGSAYELPQAILKERLDDFVLVDDAELKRAIIHYAEYCHVLAEHAGAAALAGALKMAGEIRGKKVGLVLSGANITLDQLRDALAAATAK